MKLAFTKSRIAVAAAAAFGVTTLSVAPTVANAGSERGRTTGTYAAGDFHNHTTCSDGSISMQKLVKKATDKADTPWGLDWFVQAGHGGNGNRNCTLVEDASLATPAYPLRTGTTPFDVPTAANPSPSQYAGPSTTWAQSTGAANIKGSVSGSGATQNMWRWQSIQEFQYPLIEYLSAYLNKPLFLGIESVVAGHEHTSMSVISGQIPMALDAAKLPTSAGYTALGNADALAQWQYCFDRAVTDTSRGAASQWDCSVAGSLNGADPSWNELAKKLVPANPAGSPSNGFGTANGAKGHHKTVEAVKWMKQFHGDGSYYIPAHLERAGPFNPDGNNGFNIEHLRNFNNAAPNVAFGFETQPGHGASSERGEYFPRRNAFPTSATTTTLVDSVGGTTWGGTGVYGAQIGGVWDALLGEGRNWWFFASSDWHNRGQFGPDDRRSTQDFLPGEYQRNYTMVRHGGDAKLRPQAIVDGLRTGNNWVASGQLIDRLAFVVCVDNDRGEGRSAEAVRELALHAAMRNADVDKRDCATMGEKLVVRPGADIVVAVAVRDPDGANYSPYGFDNPSLAQIGVKQALNKPVLDHVDVIRGHVTGYKQPGSADYAGEWPRTWLANPDLATVPAAAKNSSAALIETFGKNNWESVRHDREYKVMSFRIRAVKSSQYVRLRGTNLPANVPFETDANGSPLADVHTNATTTNVANQQIGSLKIPCTAVGTHVPPIGTPVPAGAAPIDGCPTHLPSINGVKYVAYDVAAWSDLWFYANPIFVEVRGSARVAGIR
ncbi:MAG TPA: hypothetical protein VGP22_02055 [Albitalea sp.]|jgi:hypothetical protein|nr:hypothetical protein [Albitalea sp.]